jgi:hypothetical protein
MHYYPMLIYKYILLRACYDKISTMKMTDMVLHYNSLPIFVSMDNDFVK